MQNLNAVQHIPVHAFSSFADIRVCECTHGTSPCYLLATRAKDGTPAPPVEGGRHALPLRVLSSDSIDQCVVFGGRQKNVDSIVVINIRSVCRDGAIVIAIDGNHTTVSDVYNIN